MSNNINNAISEDDERYGRGKSAANMAREMMESLRLACPFGVTFIQGVPMDKKDEAEAELKHHFELWANSWIAPKLRAIIAKERK